MNERDIKFMKEALAEARKGFGRTSPNPAVGAVIVRNGRVIAKGYHHKASLPHAEVEALNRLGGKALANDTLYVTLEPCNHHGKTPPCTEAILKSGLRRVVIGMKDPNPNVSGGGSDFLRANGVSVTTGVLEKECQSLNEVFIKFVTSGRPFVVVKSAMTLDGWTATSTGNSKWVTNEKSRQFVHRLRDQLDAVLVGIGTVIADNPQLTTRLKRGKGKDPIRIVLDTHLRMPSNSRILSSDSKAETIIVSAPGAPRKNLKIFEDMGVSTLICPTEKGRIDLSSLLDILGKMAITSLLVEGGASVVGSFIKKRLIDKFYIFKSPKILGGDDGISMAKGPGAVNMDQCLVVKNTRFKRFGEDFLIEGYPEYE